MFPKTMAEHIEFHRLLWSGLLRVVAELLSWPQAVDVETSEALVRYDVEKQRLVKGTHHARD